MIDQDENNPPVEVGTTPQQPNQQDPTAYVPAHTQQEYFDAFSSLGINDKEKMSLLTAQGFDPDSSYNMIMDDYNAKREEMLANIERLEKLEEESKKKESTSASGAEGFESGGTDFGEQAFGQEVAVADPRNILTADADDNLLSAYEFSKKAQELRELAKQEQDQGRRNEIMAEARELSAQAHVFNRKASDAMNQVFEFNGSDMRINAESDVDANFMMREMARRGFEDDARVRQEFGFLGIENRAELEEFKMLGGDVDNLGRNLDQLREGQWDESTGLERLWDNAYTTFGAGTTGAAAGLADILGGVFGVDSEDNSIAKYYRNKTAKLNIQNQNSRIKGLEKLGIPSDYYNMGVLDTAQAAFSDSTALRKFVSVDLPDTIGMVFGEAAIFMGTRGMGRSGMLADRLARSGKIFGKGAQALSIGQSMLSAGAQSLAPTLLAYIPRSYEGFRDRHPDAPQSQALFFGALGGMAEGMMSALMLGMGKGSVAAISRPFNKAGTRASIQKEVRNAIGKKGGSPFLADMGAEGLEEGFVAYTEQLLNALSDVANGKKPQEVNMHSVLDAAFVGLLGGSGPATLSAAASGFSHTSNMKVAQNRADVARRLRYEYESEKDPKKKAFKRAAYVDALKKLKNVQEKDVAMYESLDQNQVDELMGVHQEIAQISSDLQKGEYINGAEITKEEKDAMKSRLETLFTRKAEIEMQAEAKAFKDSVPDSISVPDAGNQEAPAKERTVDKVEKKSHESIPEASEAAPADVQQQEGQLSMFDENTMDDMVQRKEDPKATAESPTAEAETTDTEMVSDEAAKETKKETEAAKEAEVEEDAFELDLAAGQEFDLKDTKVVGEGAGQVPLQVAATVNRMKKAFGKALSAAGAKLKAHRTMESFNNIDPRIKAQNGYLEKTDADGQVVAYYNPKTNEIHLSPLVDSMDVMEEFGHMVLKPMIGKNAAAREALYKEMEEIAKGKSLGARNVKKILEQTKQDYGNRPLSEQQEEAIISVLVNYANDSSSFKGVENRIIKAINKIAKSFGFKKNIISGKEGLFKLAEKFKEASEGVETEVAVEEAPTAEAPAAEAETTAPSEQKLDEEAPAEEEATQEKKAVSKKRVVLDQGKANRFYNRILSNIKGLASNADIDAMDTANSEPAPRDGNVRAGRTLRGLMMRGERIFAEYENDITAQELANGEREEGVFYYDGTHSRKMGPTGKPVGPKFQKRNWEKPNHGPNVTPGMVGGYQVTVRPDGKGGYVYEVFMAKDADGKMGQKMPMSTRIVVGPSTSENILDRSTSASLEQFQEAVRKAEAERAQVFLNPKSTNKEKRNANLRVQEIETARDVVLQVHETIKNPSRAAEGRKKIEDHANEVARRVSRILGPDTIFESEYAAATTEFSLKPPTTDQKVEAFMDFLNKSSFWGWGEGKNLGDRPHAGDVLRKELAKEIEAERSKDIGTVAKEIASDKSLSEEQKRKALEEATTNLLGDTEGISTPESDAINQSEDISSMEGRMSIRRRQEFDYLRDTEIFYESHPYLGVGQAAVSGGRYTSFRVDRSIKVNDYFHFRNWYNKQTGNQSADRIQNMYYIKDGKKYKVKPPRPKVDKTGKPVYMEVPLNPRQKRRSESFERQDAETDVRNQAAAIKDENRKLFGQLPWKGLVNASMFEPEARPPLERLPADVEYRMSLIAQKNIQAAIEMGLTKEDIQKRLDDSGRSGTIQPLNRVQDGDLVNATGLKLMDDAGDGDNVGMFSVRSEFELEKAKAPFKAIADSVRSFFGKTEEGSIDDLMDVFTIVMGYDRTGKRRQGITSGIVALLGLEGQDVVSTHVDVATAQKIKSRFLANAIAQYKKTGKTSGEFAIGFSTLDPNATLGNPDVFIQYMEGVKKLVESGEITPTEFLTNASGVGIKADAIPSLRYALEQEANRGDAVAADVLNNILLKVDSSNKYYVNEGALTKDHVLTMINAMSKHHKNFPDSFSSRKKLISANLAHRWLDSLGAEGADMKYEDRVSDYYNDSALSSAESATLTAYTKFPYELEVIVEPDASGAGGVFKLKGVEVQGDPGLGFGGKVIATNPSKMKHMKKLYRLEDIDPDYKFKSESLGATKEQEQARTPRERALDANRYSLYEFNQEAQDVDTSDTSEGGRASVRRRGGFRTVRTDQGSWQMRELNGFQRWRNKWLRRLQDKYIDVFQLQEDVEAARGRRSADQDFRMAEELMYGKAAEDLNKLDEKVDKLTELMKEKGFTVQEISDYIYALHAKERNALIAERTEGEETEGSGMSNGRADEIIASFQNKQEDVREILEIIRDIQQDTRDTMVKFGLESQETIDAFEAQFENYVPLSGIAIDEETSVTSAYPTGGAGMSVHGPTTKRAEGRKSEATNILAQIIAQNSSVHIKARTNEALQTLHNLVEDNPNKNVWAILDGKDVNSQDPHIVSVRVNGEQKYIRFKDASYAETLRNMNLPQTGFFVKMLRAPSNWLRRSFTTLNPEFMISNFSRDIQAAMFNAAAEADIEGGLIEGKGIIREMLSMVPKTLKVLMRAESPRAMKTLFAENPELERYYQDFKDDGGKTGWSYAKPLDQIASELEKKTSDKNALQNMLGKAENFAEVVEGYNDAFENSIRLSAYIAARKNGVSREKAAQMAKNITVNFNKSGEYGQLLNSVYLFFNASVQGSFRLGKSLLTMKPPTYPDGTQRAFKDRFNNAQKMAAALTVFSGMAAMLALAMSDEDEDGELYYNKIPDYIKERNLIFMRPNGKDYFKIPLPYGFSMFANLGTAAVEVGAGHKEIDTAMMQMVSSFMNSFSPISFGQSKDLFTKAGKSAVPTVFKPLVDVMTNETYFGGPVYTENLPYGLQRPESSLSFRSPESVKSFFRWMNEATGGSVDVKGDLDFNPDKMYYIFEYFIGGAGKFVTRSGEVARGLAAKAEDNDFKIEANDVPFARILYGEPSKYMDMEDYRSRRQEVMQLYKELNNNPRSDKPERYIGVRKLNNILKKLDKNLEALRAAKRRALDIDDYTQRMIRIQEIEDKERKVVMQFNKYYEQIRKD